MDIVIQDDIIGLYGHELNKNTHKHHAIQLISSLTTIYINDDSFNEAIIINSDIDHYVTSNSKCLTIFIEPETPIGYMMKNKLQNYRILQLSQFGLNLTNNISNIKCNINKIIFLYQEYKVLRKVDPRIEIVIDYIQKNNSSNITIHNLSDVAFLSNNRLRHLFKEKIGLSLQRYITWSRLFDATKEILLNNQSITDIAYKYNFSDSSHFSKTFKNNFGINFKTILLGFKK